MAEQDIIQNLIARLGQSQDERLPTELDPDFFKIDERDPATLLAQARALAARIRYYSHDPKVASGDWSEFFPPGDDAALLARDDGLVPPHLGLFGAFLELYRLPQAVLNELTAKHLDFQYQDVLRFAPKPAQPDHAHVLLELKKGTAPLALSREHLFSAGKDARGSEMLYRPVRDRDVVIGHAKVEALHSVFSDRKKLYFAPVANSADGKGAALDPARPRWRPFGGDDLDAAPIGFALASPVLRMQEGRREVTVELGLPDDMHSAADLGRAFCAYVTGPKGWLGPFFPTGAAIEGGASLTFALEASVAPVVDCDPKLHEPAFAAPGPVVKFLLRPDAGVGHADLAGMALGSARLRVEVKGLRSLALENDNGSLDPKKVFQPFGPQPALGSRFMVGSEEAFGKRLRSFTLHLGWAGGDDFKERYDKYGDDDKPCKLVESGVLADLAYADRDGAHGADQWPLLAPGIPDDIKVSRQAHIAGLDTNALTSAGFRPGKTHDFKKGASSKFERFPERREQPLRTSPRAGCFTITLKEDFLHAYYRQKSVENAILGNKIVLKEPYTPTVREISLDYVAESAGSDQQFFHIGCFGQRREDGAGRRVNLLPRYPDEGELLIGLSGVAGGDGVSLLLQVAEGSALPDLAAQPVTWSALCGDDWRPLRPQEIHLDTTGSLRASGIVALSLPLDADTEHTWMPRGLVWLRAAIAHNSGAACRLVDVATNAVEVCRVAVDGQLLKGCAALPAKRIAKLKTPVAAVKAIRQPYPGFGGRSEESDAMLRQRAAERLRHRQRCITAWDYERLVLEAFPTVHKVKCVPHAGENCWLAPGNVMLVVVPDRRRLDSIDPLRPGVDHDTLDRIEKFARAHAGGQVEIRARNPRYQTVRLEFKVCFQSGLPFDFYRHELEEALKRRLSPWAFDTGSPIDFGGRLYRSVLLDFVEEQAYVDFVTDFRFGLADGDGSLMKDVAELAPEAPDVIFVSDTDHTITEFQET